MCVRYVCTGECEGLCFGNDVFLFQHLSHSVDDAVHIAGTLGGAVPLGYLDILVDGDRDGNLWETEQFGYSYLHMMMTSM